MIRIFPKKVNDFSPNGGFWSHIGYIYILRWEILGNTNLRPQHNELLSRYPLVKQVFSAERAKLFHAIQQRTTDEGIIEMPIFI